MSQTKRKKDTLRTWVFQDFPSNNTQGKEDLVRFIR